MKTIPPACPEPEVGPKYWRSLDELAETPSFRQWVEREFPAGASELADPLTRRHFVKIMSASFLLAGVGLTGCRRPEETILPFGKAPENAIPGVPQFYATARPLRGSAVPLVARSNEGRPTKVEGNALHPDSNGGTDIQSQASVLNLYDPDRATRFSKRGATISREAALQALAQAAAKGKSVGGKGLCFLTGRSSSPSRARLQQLISQQLPQARWFAHEAVDFDIHRQAASKAFGSAVRPYYKLDQADAILSLDCDFLGAEEDSYIQIRRFAARRKLKTNADSMSRLYCVEGLFTLTGLNADHRLRASNGELLATAAKIALEVNRLAGNLGSLAPALQTLAGAARVDEKWAAECAADLVGHKGRAVVLAGYRQPLAVQLIAQALNAALGAVGNTVVLLPAPAPAGAGIRELAQALDGGSVETLVILDGNPGYDAPGDLNWAQVQKKAKQTIRLGYHEDETSDVDVHLPAAHYLESWGDARTADGTLVPVQPLVEPLFGGVTDLEVLARIGGMAVTKPHDIVRETFRLVAGGDSQKWSQFLHDGFLAGSAATPIPAALDQASMGRELAAAKTLPVPAQGQYEVVFHRDYRVDDGRYNNNGWLQELPDPITKMVWENVMVMSQKTAMDLGLKIFDRENNSLTVPVVRISLEGRQVEGPAWIQPGMAEGTIGLALGYGRSRTGRIGKGSGYNAYQLRGSNSLHAGAGAKVEAVGRTHPLSTTQNHWAMEGRPIVREANLEQYKAHPTFAAGMDMHEPPGAKDAEGRPLSLYPNPLDIAGKDGKSPRDRAVHAWGMSIDLNSCVGCSACVTACQSENNIPIVGKDQVSRNREMHWLRIDRYYSGEDVSNPQAVVQPMLCQHCESAPCESVCPVNATAHDEEGLNVMAYNRCVGTRYCSNNCPYKVRRFNYFDYNRRTLEELRHPFYPSPLTHATDGEWDVIRWFKNPDKGMRTGLDWELLKLAKNPDVTVRMRGVMEKCSFCLQRIEQAKIARKVKARDSGDVEVPDGTILTACQQACPAEAIVFGNVKDPESKVSKLKHLDRDYSVLEFLLTKPRTTYLAKVRNPNPKMPDYAAMPATMREWEKMGNSLEAHGAGQGGAHGQAGGANGTPAAAGHGQEKKGAH